MAKQYKEGNFPGRDWKGMEGNKMKQSKGKGKVANGSGKKGIGGLAAKKPKAKANNGSGPGAKVPGSASALAKKSPKKLKKSKSGAVKNGSGKAKLAGYWF